MAEPCEQINNDHFALLLLWESSFSPAMLRLSVCLFFLAHFLPPPPLCLFCVVPPPTSPSL